MVPLRDADERHGGKAAHLAWLIKHGRRVPDGVVVSSPDDPALPGWIAGDQAYAVRSSASVEDSSEHSFAGQFDTVLDVAGLDAARAAIERVVASARDARLAPYLEHAGTSEADIEMHVVVQEMVAAVCSGVAFSRNPLTGLSDVLIEAVDGTGERLVSGEVTPERWVRHWGDWTERPEASALPETVAAELAETVTAVADDWGAPIDVEWAWDGERLYLLQVRPMTAMDVTVYSNRLAKEFLPGIVPPLVWSVNVPIVNSAWLDLFRSAVGELDLRPEDLSRQFAYRAYFNMSAVGDIFEAMAMPRDLLEVLIGIEGGDARPTFRPRAGVMRHMPRMGLMAARLLRYHRELDKIMPAAQARIKELEARDLDGLSDEALIDHLADVEATVRTVAFANIVAPLLFNAYASVLRRRLAKRGVDATAIDLGAGDPGLADYDPSRQLATLAARVGELDEPTRERVAAGQIDLVEGGDAFMQRFGHVADSGNDFSHVPWREDPARLWPLLTETDRSTEGSSRDVLPSDLSRFDRIVAGRTARYRLERERVSYTYTRGYGLFRPSIMEIARRLVDRGQLPSTDDVFYLTRDEMQAALGDGTHASVAGVAQERNDDIERVRDVDMPEVIFGDEFEPAPPVDPDHQLRGTPTSRGVHVATARVVNGVDEAARVALGDIVVIPWSDVGWTPMLAKAGAIVAESGGLLSHSSIIAREFGIPCVVSVRGAMRIPDGAHVRVDGFTGEVQWELAA